MDTKQQKFLDLLNSQYAWPEVYPFKFVIKSTEVQALCDLFPLHSPEQKLSSGGQYVSLTFKIEVKSGEEVLEFYQRAQGIPGLIAL